MAPHKSLHVKPCGLDVLAYRKDLFNEKGRIKVS